MIVRYGKEVQMKKISRDLKAIRTAIEFDRQSFEKYYKAPLKNIKPKCRICGSEQAELFVKIWGNMIITDVKSANLFSYIICRILNKCIHVILIRQMEIFI